jgi:hypothetical protein
MSNKHVQEVKNALLRKAIKENVTPSDNNCKIIFPNFCKDRMEAVDLKNQTVFEDNLIEIARKFSTPILRAKFDKGKGLDEVTLTTAFFKPGEMYSDETREILSAVDISIKVNKVLDEELRNYYNSEKLSTLDIRYMGFDIKSFDEDAEMEVKRFERDIRD